MQLSDALAVATRSRRAGCPCRAPAARPAACAQPCLCCELATRPPGGLTRRSAPSVAIFGAAAWAELSSSSRAARCQRPRGAYGLVHLLLRGGPRPLGSESYQSVQHHLPVGYATVLFPPATASVATSRRHADPMKLTESHAAATRSRRAGCPCRAPTARPAACAQPCLCCELATRPPDGLRRHSSPSAAIFGAAAWAGSSSSSRATRRQRPRARLRPCASAPPRSATSARL